jgi:jumonji domain-containing protein 7
MTDPTKLVLEPGDSTTPWLTVDPSAINPNDALAQYCKPLVVTLEPGQVLYLPALWFHSVFQVPDQHGLCVAINFWYDMDFTGPLYPLYNYLRHTTMIQDGRAQEIQHDPE